MLRTKISIEQLVKIQPTNREIKMSSEAISRFLKDPKASGITLKGACAFLEITAKGYVNFAKIVTIISGNEKVRRGIGFFIETEPEFRNKYIDQGVHNLGKFSSSDFIDETGEIKLLEFIEIRNFIINLFLKKYRKIGDYWVRKEGVPAHQIPAPVALQPQKPQSIEPKVDQPNHFAIIGKLVEASAMISSLPKEDQIKILNMIAGF